MVAERYAESERLRRAGTVSQHPCPACGYPTLDTPGSFEICWFCQWEDDGVRYSDADAPSGANYGLTLRRAAECVLAHHVAAIPEAPLTPSEYFVADAVSARRRLDVLLTQLLETGSLDPLRADIEAAKTDLTSAINHDHGEQPGNSSGEAADATAGQLGSQDLLLADVAATLMLDGHQALASALISSAEMSVAYGDSWWDGFDDYIYEVHVTVFVDPRVQNGDTGRGTGSSARDRTSRGLQT